MTSVPLAMSDGKATLPKGGEARALCEKGDRAIGTGNNAGAADAFERSLEAEASSYARLGAGIAHYFLEDYAKARIQFEAVLLEFPGLKNVELMLQDCVEREHGDREAYPGKAP
jgi:tetratricopeptide (TPR) repeat protein